MRTAQHRSNTEMTEQHLLTTSRGRVDNIEWAEQDMFTTLRGAQTHVDDTEWTERHMLTTSRDGATLNEHAKG